MTEVSSDLVLSSGHDSPFDRSWPRGKALRDWRFDKGGHRCGKLSTNAESRWENQQQGSSVGSKCPGSEESGEVEN